MFQQFVCSATTGYLTWLTDGGPLDVGLAVGLSWAITWQWNSLGAILSLTAVVSSYKEQLYIKKCMSKFCKFLGIQIKINFFQDKK